MKSIATMQHGGGSPHGVPIFMLLGIHRIMASLL